MSEPGKNLVSMNGPMWQLKGFWQDRSVRENGAQLYGPRVSNFLSHRIVKSLTFRIYGKLKFQCTRKVPQNPRFCPGSIQNTFIIFLDISPPDFRTYLSKQSNLGNQKYANLEIQKPRFTNKCPVRRRFVISLGSVWDQFGVNLSPFGICKTVPR